MPPRMHTRTWPSSRIFNPCESLTFVVPRPLLSHLRHLRHLRLNTFLCVLCGISVSSVFLLFQSQLVRG